MRTLALLVLLLPATFQAQIPAPALAKSPPAQVQAELQKALTGDWVGILEYRDYSEPDDSPKRVQLPTWLTVTPSPDGLKQYFLYDDGPTKIVDETLFLRFKIPESLYEITNDHGRLESYKVVGYDALHDGRGDLIITGPTIDNNRPAETRIILTIHRNLLTWTEENRTTALTPYVFRHRYVFTRAHAPDLKPTH